MGILESIPANTATENVSIIEEGNKEKYLKTTISILDSLRKCYSAVNKIYGTPLLRNRFLPVINSAQAAMLYRKTNSRSFQVGNQLSLFGWEKKGAINPKLFSFLGGPFKFAVNTLVSSSKDTIASEDAKFRTLTGNGGNLVGSIYLPLFHLTTKGTWTFIELSPKFASEIPILNSPFEPKSLFGNVNIGADINFSVRLPIFGGSSLFGYMRPSYIIGSKSYLEALNTTEHFFLIQYTVGVDIPNVGKIGLLLPTSSDLDIFKSNTMQLSFQISPNNVLK